MDGVFETQPDRTDLPLVVMPVVIESMIGPFKQNFTMLDNVARVRMYEDFTLDEDTIVERCKDANAVMVIGFHCADAILDRLDAKCYAFGGTGVASYINLEKTKERGIRVCNVLHYGDHAVAEHAMALLMELTRHAGALDMQVKQGDWDGADGFELFGKKLGIIGLGGIGQTVAGIANAFGMKVSAWNSHVPAQVFENLNVTPVEDMNELILEFRTWSACICRCLTPPVASSRRRTSTRCVREPCSSTPPAPKSSNPAHCSQDFNAETFRRPWTCSIMSRLPPTILCARFPASCSPRTSHGAPTARISA